MIRMSWHFLSVFLLFLGIHSPLHAGDTANLLFYVSAEKSVSADIAKGESKANFSDRITRVNTGPIINAQPTWAIQWEDDGVLAWPAAGNLYAERGTLAFYWRARYELNDAPFVIFRAGFSDHSSWDMAWLRIDWNGNGFDAFVTDANLRRTRVSYAIESWPTKEEWTHIAFSWDETQGVALYINGEKVAQHTVKAQHLDFNVGLDGFGLAGRVLSPHQVQSRYNFLRGSDIAHLAIYDRMLTDNSINQLPRSNNIIDHPTTIAFDKFSAWQARFSWDKDLPPALPNKSLGIKKIEFTDARDIKQWMFKGIDGIAETTWPGVYNRSRLQGRNDYFQLPDWNTYVEGGIHYDLTLPAQKVNWLDTQGAAFGDIHYRASSKAPFKKLASRKKGQLRSSHLIDVTGGELRFTNREQETPIQEFWAYEVKPASAPKGTHRLSYKIQSDVRADYENLKYLTHFIAGRFPEDARQTVMATPQGASIRRAINPKINPTDLPFVHVLIPASVSHHPAEKSVTRSWAYGWENMYDGLDGIEIKLPPLNLPATKNGLIALNLQIKDPIWPERNMLDISFSVKPNQAYTLWLDIRDRILNDQSLYLTLASSAAEFNATDLNGTEIELVFTSREQAKVEHLQDRFNQVKDNWGNLVEEHTSSQRMALYRRAHADISDLLRVDPEHSLGRLYWHYMSFKSQPEPKTPDVTAPAHVPFWAYAQLEDLKLTRHFINWWIDQRQSSYGDFGGGLSDDTDMVQQWPGLALMGIDKEKITQSLIRLSKAIDKNAMLTHGLSTIETDELHVYEEGINSNSALFTVLMGDPVATSRLMQTVKSLDNIIKTNPQGHKLFSSNWYGGNKVYRGPNWEWQKPYSFYVAHPAFLLAEYAKDKSSQELIIGLAKAYLAHAYIDEDGRFTLPNEINWRTGDVRGGELNQGAGAADVAQIFYAAYLWTHDEQFLQGLNYRVERGGPAQLARLNNNFLDKLNPSGQWRKEVTESALPSSTFENFIAWETTGDKQFLNDLYRQEIKYKYLHQYFHTEGHWWTDRVDARAELLQRARMGGVALARNRMIPGHTLSWNFNKDEGLSVALLMPKPNETAFSIIGYNLSDKTITANAEGYLVKSGTWRLRVGEDTNGDDKIDRLLREEELVFGRFETISLDFLPHANTIIEMTLIKAAPEPETLADLALSPFDLMVDKKITLGIYNIGTAPANSFEVQLQTLDGTLLQTRVFDQLAPSKNLSVQRVEAVFDLPRNISVDQLRVKIIGSDPEISLKNNQLDLKNRNLQLAY